MLSARYRLIGLLLIAVPAFMIRVPFFSVPPERDEGLYATIARIIIDGGVPYRDSATYRAPGIYYIYASLFKLFGEAVEVLRIGSAVFAVLTCLVIYRFASRVFDEKAGLLAAFLYAIFSSGPMIQGGLANTEAFMMLPLVAATYLFYVGYKEQRHIYLFIAGILSGVACLIKEAAAPNYLLFLIFLPVSTPELLSSRGLKELLKKMMTLCSGFLLPLLTVFGYLAVNNALTDYLVGVYNWNTSYGTYRSDLFWSRLVDRGVYSLGREYSFLWFASIIAVIVAIFKCRTMDIVYVLLWAVLSFAGVCLGSMFWPHYFIQMIPSLSLCAAYGTGELFKGLRSRSFVRFPAWVAAALLSISVVYAIKTDYRFYLVYDPDEISTQIYGSDIFANSKKIAEYIKQRSGPSDYIYQNRWDSEIYFLSQRKSPTKYLDHPSIHAAPDVLKAMEELRNDILYKKPKYIIWYHPREGEIPAYVVGPILNIKYDLETEIGGVKVFRLKGWRGNNL